MDFYIKDTNTYSCSRVYAIDTVRHEFLVVDSYGNFKWGSTDDCELVEKGETERSRYDDEIVKNALKRLGYDD